MSDTFSGQTIRDPLKVYCYYRICLSAMLLITFALSYPTNIMGANSPGLYKTTMVIFLIVSLLTLLITNIGKFQSKTTAFLIISTDIAFITILAYASGGVTHNLSLLLVVTVAAGGLLVQGRLGTLLAALASISVFTEQTFTILIHSKHQSEDFFNVGVLGMIFFGTSLLSQTLAKHLSMSEAATKHISARFQDLQSLNHQIIQRLQTGIMVIDENNNIQLMNESVEYLLGISKEAHEDARNQKLSTIAPELLTILNNWQENPERSMIAFRNSSAAPEIYVAMTATFHLGRPHTLVFMDDKRRIASQAEHLKLAALARLTGSIAHEIRNPLSAIHQAAQLMIEKSEDPETITKLASISHNHCTRINEIIENILSLSRQNKAKATLIPLTAWIRSFMEDYKQTSQHQGAIDINLRAPNKDQLIQIDTSHLRQIMQNLFDNGIRHSHQVTKKHQLSIQIGTLEQNDLSYLEVIDYGAGVPEEKQKKLFEPFYTTEQTGTGLGLYVARELCENNLAHLSYIDRPDESGACFRIVFPHHKSHKFN